MAETAALLLRFSWFSLLVIFLIITVPYGLAFYLTAPLLNIKDKNLGKAYMLSVLNLIVPFIMISAYDSLGAEWIVFGISASFIIVMLFIKGFYNTTYLKALFCYIVADIILAFLFFIAIVILAVIYGKPDVPGAPIKPRSENQPIEVRLYIP
jgi:hypothetical protein